MRVAFPFTEWSVHFWGESRPRIARGETITATFTVANTGARAGADVPQAYLTDAAGDRRVRLLGFERVELEPGASKGSP
jgi:hypothetical protein